MMSAADVRTAPPSGTPARHAHTGDLVTKGRRPNAPRWRVISTPTRANPQTLVMNGAGVVKPANLNRGEWFHA